MSRRLDGRQSKRRRQQRSSSPKYDKYARQKKPDSGTDELIRFVREYQIERQPTILRLQKLAPLPGIGRSVLPPVVQIPTEASYNDSSNSTDDSEPDDGLRDSYQDADDDLDAEIACCTENFTSTDKLLGDISRYNTPNNEARGHSVNSRIQHQTHGGLSNVRLSQTYGLPKLRKLPPLSRDELPGRPSAPPPSHTPKPASVSSDEEDVIDEEEEHLNYVDPF